MGLAGRWWGGGGATHRGAPDAGGDGGGAEGDGAAPHRRELPHARRRVLVAVLAVRGHGAAGEGPQGAEFGADRVDDCHGAPVSIVVEPTSSGACVVVTLPVEPAVAAEGLVDRV